MALTIARFIVGSLVLCGVAQTQDAVAVEEAQEAPSFAPAKQLAKLDRLIGTWRGKGTSKGPMGAMPWTATSTYKKVLGGHFVQEDMRIEFGEAMPGALSFRNLFGWDNETKRYVSASIGNTGEVVFGQVTWAGPDTMVSAHVSTEKGVNVTERWVTKIASDKITFRSQRASGASDFATYVTGEMVRTKDAGVPANASAFMGGVAKQMTTFKKICGDYRVKGSMVMMPGQPKMDIGGDETLELIFGGTVLDIRIHGDAVAGMPPYEGWGAIGWNAERHCYVSIWADNMGAISTGDANWVGDALVTVIAGTKFGQPMVERMVMHCGENGVSKVANHTAMGTLPPVLSFEATYTKKK